MKLINTDGLAIFGSGSEWFWTMLQFIIVAGTLIGLYRQLRIQSSQSAIEQLRSFDHEWESERLTRHKLDVLVALRDGTAPADVPLAAADPVAGFWERIAGLTRDGHIDQRLLWNDLGQSCQGWWVTLAPFARRQRAGGGALIYEHFEWLAGVMVEMNRRAGAPIIDEAMIASGLERHITAYQDQIRVEQALRTVTIASPDALTVGQPGAPAAAQG